MPGEKSTRERQYVRWFDELDESTQSLVGGKNAGLGELVRAGLRVPPGFASSAR